MSMLAELQKISADADNSKQYWKRVGKTVVRDINYLKGKLRSEATAGRNYYKEIGGSSPESRHVRELVNVYAVNVLGVTVWSKYHTDYYEWGMAKFDKTYTKWTSALHRAALPALGEDLAARVAAYQHVEA